jgi:hypothetical protein
MKKLFTLTLLAVLVSLGANAQGLRKTWDFRNGFSQKTVNALKADQEEFGNDKYWRNYESDASKADEQHFWNASKEVKNANGYACTHNGGVEKVIEELEGLKINPSNAKKFVITYAGAQAANEFESEGGPALGEMIPHGQSYLWLNGKKETISFSAEVNQTIKIAIESHAVNKAKLGEARGISLSASNGTLTPKFEGNPVPTYYTEYEWDLTGDAGAVADLTIQTTNGCHIYYIIVGEGDDPNANKTKVAYLTEGNDGTAEAAYQALVANDMLNVSVTNLMENMIRGHEFWSKFDAIVVGPSVNIGAGEVKELISFYPILNLNAKLYDNWGYGTATTVTEPIAVINNLKSNLFTGFEAGTDYLTEDEVNFFQLADASYSGVKLGEFFVGDEIVAADVANTETAAIHTHNLYHNAYIFMPAEAAAKSAKLLANAIDALKSSKSEITKTAAPKITLEYKNLNTNISMAMASSNLPKPHIYYTLDGSEPTATSTEYIETLNVTAPCTVKAVAIAEGYLLSDVTTKEVEIFTQPAAPVIAQSNESGATTVTLTCETEGVDIWYNYQESNDTALSMKYTEPFVLKAPATVTAFSVAAGQVFSELATQRVVVKDAVVRRDVIGHFDANTDEWGVNASGTTGSTVYHFSWGKNAASIYDTTQDPIATNVDPETGDETPVYPEKPYEFWVPSEENEWELKSKGQVLIYQTLTAGSDVGNDAGYNPETSGDIIDYAPITKQDIQFGGKVSGEPFTGAIQSRKKFQGPFNLVTYVGTASGNEARMVLQVSPDSVTWENVGDAMVTSAVKRLWKGYERNYEGTNEVYVRIMQESGSAGAQIYDIYVLNAGETSAALKAQFDEEYANYTGIEAIANKTAKVTKGIYNLNGIRQNNLKRGLNIIVKNDGSVEKVLVK